MLAHCQRNQLAASRCTSVAHFSGGADGRGYLKEMQASFPGRFYDITSSQCALIQKILHFLPLPLSLLVVLRFALLVLDVLGFSLQLPLSLLLLLEFDVFIDHSHLRIGQFPRSRENIPSVLGSCCPKSDFFISIFDDEDSLEIDLTLPELRDRPFDLQNRAYAYWSPVDGQRCQTPRGIHI